MSRLWAEQTILVHGSLDLVVEIFHDAAQRFRQRLIGNSGPFELLHALAGLFARDWSGCTRWLPSAFCSLYEGL